MLFLHVFLLKFCIDCDILIMLVGRKSSWELVVIYYMYDPTLNKYYLTWLGQCRDETSLGRNIQHQNRNVLGRTYSCWILHQNKCLEKKRKKKCLRILYFEFLHLLLLVIWTSIYFKSRCIYKIAFVWRTVSINVSFVGNENWLIFECNRYSYIGFLAHLSR